MRHIMSSRPLTVAAAAVLVMLAITATGYCSGKTFGVRPGSIVQSAYFGFGSGAIMPVVGIDFLGVSASVDSADLDISAALYVPHFGVRYYFTPPGSAGGIRPYVEGSVLYSFATVDLGEGSGESEDTIKDILTFWGFTGIFGCEYYFSERFSVAGEYGLRYIRDSAELGGDDLTISYKRSYTGAVLSFHF